MAAGAREEGILPCDLGAALGLDLRAFERARRARGRRRRRVDCDFARAGDHLGAVLLLAALHLPQRRRAVAGRTCERDVGSGSSVGPPRRRPLQDGRRRRGPRAERLAARRRHQRGHARRARSVVGRLLGHRAAGALRRRRQRRHARPLAAPRGAAAGGGRRRRRAGRAAPTAVRGLAAERARKSAPSPAVPAVAPRARQRRARSRGAAGGASRY